MKIWIARTCIVCCFASCDNLRTEVWEADRNGSVDELDAFDDLLQLKTLGQFLVSPTSNEILD